MIRPSVTGAGPREIVPRISLVIPCFNEEKNISPLLDQIQEILSVDRTIEVILVENGSSDCTRQKLFEGVVNLSRVSIVLVNINRGYGYGIKRGLETARGEILAWTHSDLQTSLEDVLMGLGLWRSSGNCIVKGRRVGRPRSDLFFSLGMGLLCSALFRMRLEEINAQPTLVPRELLEDLLSGPDDFGFDLFSLVLAKRKELNEIRFGVRFERRSSGKSSWNTSALSKIAFITRSLRYILQLRRAVS